MKAECSACHYVTKVKEYQWDINCEADKERSPMKLCDLCANTPSGNALQYPQGKDTHTLQAVCWIGNKILDEIRKQNG